MAFVLKKIVFLEENSASNLVGDLMLAMALFFFVLFLGKFDPSTQSMAHSFISVSRSSVEVNLEVTVVQIN